MPRLAGKVSILVALVAALAPAHASADVLHGMPGAGRNFVGAQLNASIDPYRQINLLSTRVVDGGNSLNVWLLSKPNGCSNWGVATARVPIDAQGRFHADLDFGVAGDTGTIDGRFVDTKQRGTIAVATIHVHFTSPQSCDTGTFRVAAISPKHARKGAGKPKPNALFVGMTKQRSERIGVKLPVLALISPSGTEVKRFIADTNVRCKPSGRQAGGVFRIKDIQIKPDDTFDGITGFSHPVEGTDHNRALVIRAQGTFGTDFLAGTWRTHELETDSSGATTDDCDSGDLPFVAARAGRVPRG